MLKPEQQASEQKLIDSYQRRLNYLRISITDRCNLRCSYCQPQTPFRVLPHQEILRYEEIQRIVAIAATLGVTKVRVTGGEPLVRKGICGFLDRLGRINRLRDVSLTTNGVLLPPNVSKIRSAGVKRINVSLDTLQAAKFKQITGRDAFEHAWEGIMAARRLGFAPIKINVVALKGVNDDELTAFAELSQTYPFHIRFIEHMPIGDACRTTAEPLLAPEIKKHVSVLGRLKPIARKSDDGPAERYAFDNAPGEIGFIRPLSRHFCGACNRIRLTAAGQLRTCLLSDHQVDLKAPLRGNATDAEIKDIIVKAISKKNRAHKLSACNLKGVSGRMSAIGG